MAVTASLFPNSGGPPRSAAPLQAELLAHRGQDLDLDATAVVRLGGQCLQILLAAKRTWQADGREVRLLNVSNAFGDALNITNAGPLLGAEG